MALVNITGLSNIIGKINISTLDILPSLNFIWTGLGSNNNWSTSSNWNIRAPQAYDILQFAGTTRLTPFNDLTIDTPYNGITFNSGAGAFTLNGNRFVLNTGSISNSSINIQTINNDIVLGTNAGIINCNTAAIGLGGTISGSGSLTKLGATTLSLSGNNSYTGNTFINSGTVNVLNSNPFGTGTVYCSGNAAGISIASNAIPSNVIINNPIFIAAPRSGSSNIQVQKNTTLNGLITVNRQGAFVTSIIEATNNATLTFNGGISGTSTFANSLTLRSAALGTVTTFVLSSRPVILTNGSSDIITSSNFPSTIIIAVTGNKFNNITTTARSIVRTDVPLAINNDDMVMNGGRLDLNGNSQAIKLLTINTGVGFTTLTGNNIFNNSSTFANLTLNNTGGNSTYTGSISGNINLIKTGSNTLTLSGSTTLRVGPRYTGFTAISAGTLTNYALSSNPSNKVNFAQFSRTALTVNFTTPPIVGDSFILLSGRTVNLYPSVTLQNASGRTASYNSTTSTLSVIT